MKPEESSIIEEFSLDESYFFDSYAFFEILDANKEYKKYKNVEIITSKLNIFELYHGILRDHGEEKAQKAFDIYYQFAVEFDEEVIKEAVQLKIQLNKRDVSMTDCIGYCLAKQLGIKFLTGDTAFEYLDNVEFVK